MYEGIFDNDSLVNMAAQKVVLEFLVLSCVVSVILFSSSTYAFLDGLYCGAENCYDGKDIFFSLPCSSGSFKIIFKKMKSYMIFDFELITTKLIHI